MTIKNILRISVFIVTLMIFSFGANPQFSLADTCPANTQPGETSAILVGEVTDDGGDPNLTVWFQYGTTVYYSNETPHQSQNGLGIFCATITGLQSCTLYHYRAVAQNSGGTSYGQDKTFTTQCPAPTVDLKANGSDGPITIPYNTSAMLTWTSTNAPSGCTASGNWLGHRDPQGSQSTGNLTSNAYYTLTCTGPGGSANDSVAVNVSPQNHPPVANAGPNKQVEEGQSVTLEGSGSDQDGDPITYSWTCTGGTLSDYSIAQPTYTAPAVSQDTTYTCTLTVTDSHGASNSDSVNVTVKKHLSPSVDLKVRNSSGTYVDGPVDLFYNDYAVLRWTSQNANSCTASGDWSGSLSTNGSQSVYLTQVKTYTFGITCMNSGGDTSSDTVIVISHPKPPTVITIPAVVTY